MKYALVGIGNAIVDVIAMQSEAFVTQSGYAKGAMTMVNETQADALYNTMEPAIESSGGSAGNSLAVFASLGGAGAFIGKVKDDQLGAIFGHDIRAAGVHFSTPPASEGPATARCMIMVTPDAERTMCTYLGACAELSAADLDHDLISNAKITLLEGYLFDKDTAKDAFYEASTTAHAAGGKVAFTLSDASCVARHFDAFTDFVQNHVDILFANEKEIKALYKTDSFDDAVAQVKKHCGIAVLTRGSKGALVVSGDEMIHIAPAKDVKVIDTTGAGDSFSAAFLYGMTEGKDLATCGKMAAIVAGEIISQVGARPQRPLSDVLAEKMVENAPIQSVKFKPPAR